MTRAPFLNPSSLWCGGGSRLPTSGEMPGSSPPSAPRPANPARLGHPPSGPCSAPSCSLPCFQAATQAAATPWPAASSPASPSCSAAPGATTATGPMWSCPGRNPPPEWVPAVWANMDCLVHSSKKEAAYHSGGAIRAHVMRSTFEASLMLMSASGLAFSMSADAKAFHLIPMFPTAPHMSVTASVSGRSKKGSLSKYELDDM
mmetsp:Transcript_43278/g.100304  ORF Transcript_43278/g.100304 Transcript_43278/m.100304 type:complete len:203 (+) Transcript_43278:407-1015(+)